MSSTRTGRKRRLAALLLGAGLFMATSACRGSGVDTATPTTTATPSTTVHDDEQGTGANDPKVDPCTLVSKAEAEKVLGAIEQPREETDPIVRVVNDQRTCVVSLTEAPTSGANVGYTDYEAAAKFDSFRGLMDNQAKEVDGLGQHAIWVENFRVLLVLEGTELVSVQMTDVRDPDKAVSKQKAIGLASVALGRLPASKARG